MHTDSLERQKTIHLQQRTYKNVFNKEVNCGEQTKSAAREREAI
jgi:hypothetical protein